MAKHDFVFTSESVSEGHPDKVCDRISDAIVDTFLAAEPQARCGVETLATTNRIGASRLHELSRVLDVPVSFFFDDVDPVRAPAIPSGFAEPPAEAFDSDPLRRRETVELVEAYYAIADPAVRRRLFELARALGAEAKNATPDAPIRPTRRRRRQDHT